MDAHSPTRDGVGAGHGFQPPIESGSDPQAGVAVVRWSPRLQYSPWLDVEVVRIPGSEDLHIGVAGVNEIGQVVTSFGEMVANETTTTVLQFPHEKVVGFVVKLPDFDTESDAAIYYHALHLFYGNGAVCADISKCTCVLPLNRHWRWSIAIEAYVYEERLDAAGRR